MTTEKNATEKAGNLENLEEFTELTVDVNPELVSICKDSGARTEEAKTIYMKSRTMIQEIIGNKTPEDRFRQRCVIATGDLSVADIMRFMHDPIPAGVDAIKKGAPIFVDINMVKAGITKTGHKSEIICVLDEDPNAEIANRYGITRTSAGFLAARDRLDGSIIAIGNAPSALIMVCKLIEKGVRPALIIGLPVGFVNAAESKEMVRNLSIPVPSISCVGTRGGTPMAVACVNELVAIARESEE
ncbi:precorrin-8X methylmutase [Methanosarcina thermophila]|jgi:precorrin-8X/cobalt-precorrin-8 methylmutase|uniref:Precorrin-8X methylmutase n=3 Tax=Methanosarcina thermophila TaxID=2210 RepID=A0A1I6X5Z4_METTE|nr:precorrin-8X methylmutase [Methanosarcina thermophila]ALK04657.1 MAG: precorrin-8X methylmutase [Methanosarcina sp. 795]AKB13338.1 Cobalt-precorrin-8x methylmutase [Methanosarcina thermophila TM-1]AKB16027.1 Cobalt-precorrin-8x methylmutase [Methanosarcina thermophila CHTI-55]NLU57962.1 precorrin-8X methylmutase [Methanosarcina thermophila]SFT33606.1 precorrin-8X methylmutase [Methanosarcina thermophila]